jgi:hypothetical protein
LPRACLLHCLERTFVITDTPPSGMQFSHPDTEQTHSATPAPPDMAHENLFREPEAAPVQRRRDTRAGA